MPTAPHPRLYLQTLTVLSAAWNASGPRCRMSGLGHRVVAQRVIGDVVLRVHHVLDQLIALVLGVGGEEHVLGVVLRGAGELAEGGDHPGHVGVADVVLLPIGDPAPAGGRQVHVGLVDVGAVRLLRQAEREHLAGLEQPGGLALGVGVGAHPDRAQTQGGDLEGVPVVEPVEADDLGERADPVGVPAAVGGTVGRRRQQRREDALPTDVVQKLGVPDPFVVVRLQPRLAPGLEEVDRGGHDLRRAAVRVLALQVIGVEQHGGTPSGSRRRRG